MKILILRRIVQIGLLVLFALGSFAGCKILQGDISSSLFLETIPLSDPYALLQFFASGAFVGSTAIIGGLIILGFYAIFAGRAFCAFVCPMNLITDFAAFLRRKLNIDSLSEGAGFPRKLRYWILGLSLVVSFVMGIAAFEAISPISAMYRAIVFGSGVLSAGLLGALCVFLFDLFGQKHGFCGHICPLGAFYSSISHSALLRVKYNNDKCTKCMKCKQICPEPQVLNIIGKESGSVNSGECTRCGRCIEVCADYALKFSILNFAK